MQRTRPRQNVVIPRCRHNSVAFDVTSRYTGQKIDEETGLYFYQSRYYDPELGRFTQADTIVPSADTSQALNRYAYVKNNPLKFTDPDGHGWLSKAWKKIKGWIGTILTVALTVCGMPFLGAIIGSAVGAIVNGGTFRSFLIGAAIGMAAGAIAGAMGFSAPDIGSGFALTTENIIRATVVGAVTGAVSGAISSAVYGGNWGQNMLEGAMAGAVGAGVAMGTASAVGKLKAWVQGTSATEELALRSNKISDPKDIQLDPLTTEQYHFERLEEGLTKMGRMLEPYKADPNGIEYFAWLDADYKVHGPYKGSFRSVPAKLAMSKRPPNGIVIGHTHGASSPMYDTEHFSGVIYATPRDKTYFYADLGFARRNKCSHVSFNSFVAAAALLV